ncbi:DUF6340 family protein [Prolixibacteraceae bacterium Z1-6]|uniref:DUF6340 family protein n=1 Tax=Draconibacterium aestuarii TaxID=2998507 RepID=A0A9X3F2D7_9BACT|nr:DUF6340 family protein [Prolixibacteraceae bacterium Z1-6]
MKRFYFLLNLVVALLLNQGCNTLYNTKVIDIEIVEPGKVSIPEQYKTVAIRYNNCKVAPNPQFQKSYFIDKSVFHEENTDSIASKIYFESFTGEIRKQNFFDKVFEVEAQDFSSIKIRDTISYELDVENDSISNTKELLDEFNVRLFSKTINEFPNESKIYTSEKFLHPRYGLYQPNELKKIADTTHADLLLSLDYFYSVEGAFYDKNISIANEIVLIRAYWNFYDLINQEYLYSYDKADTISWNGLVDDIKNLREILPPRKDAILNAADISGVNAANYLIPHWTQVQRMYYGSGHVDLQKTDQLIAKGDWLAAAKIWKANVNNPNKSIAAKSKFNMGLVCEMQGNLEAALEWVVESFHVFGQKNKIHSANCMNYIRILGQRMQDIKIIENQIGLNN